MIEALIRVELVLISSLNTSGLVFGSLCIRDLRVCAAALDGVLYHYRDKTWLECDAVSKPCNGSYGLNEIKLGGDSALSEEGATTLKYLAEKVDTTKMSTRVSHGSNRHRTIQLAKGGRRARRAD